MCLESALKPPVFLLGKVTWPSCHGGEINDDSFYRFFPSLFVFPLQAVCLYYGIPHQQQGPFSMPGTTGCHVNMAGYSSSSCIFCCFNEWGKFCQAHTTSRRYCTCVLSIWVWRTRWTQGPINCAIASEGAAFLVRLEQNPVRKSTGLQGEGHLGVWAWVSRLSVPTLPIHSWFQSHPYLVVCGAKWVVLVEDFMERQAWPWKHIRVELCVLWTWYLYAVACFSERQYSGQPTCWAWKPEPRVCQDGGESHPITWVSCMALSCFVTTVHLMSSARWCQETVLKNQSEIIWKNDSYIVSHPTPPPSLRATCVKRR